MSERVSVRVPASTSNLGPGFDALGLALELTTTVSATPASATTITISGEGAHLLSYGPDNLVLRRMHNLADHCGLTLPSLAIHIENGIPLERGLGASGAASLGGLLVANEVLGRPLDRGALLDLACQLEGHPDNVSPSLLGGCTISVVENGHVTALHVPFPGDIVCALCIPDVRMRTHEARSVMPPTYSRADAVYNLSRTAILVAALATDQRDVLRLAVADRMHQPFRAAIFPTLPMLIDAAQEAGALGAFLSGAGSTVAAFATAHTAERVILAMAAAATAQNLGCRTFITAINHIGAQKVEQ